MAEILFRLAAEILKNLGSLAAQEVGSLRGLDDELHKLSSTVSAIQAVLLDAEEQQGSSHEVRYWIGKLKMVFFEADDLLDDFATEVTHRKLAKNKVSIFFSKSNTILYHFKISKRLKAIRKNLDIIAKDKASLNLVERRQPLLPETAGVQVNLDRETYSFVPVGEVIGRNDDKKTVVDYLLDSEVHENVEVVSIVGIGGLGKTTLAQWVYNDEMVQTHFDERMWVCVSDVFEVKLIAEKIFECASGKKVNYLQLDGVQNELRKMLEGKKYLLVLDDVWNEDALKWSRLKNILMGGTKGSKILVTTRSDVVAQVSGSTRQHKLGDLSEEEAWQLFEKMAFECNNESENLNLVEIGKEIVKRCAGVPLAIRSVGSLLRLKRTKDEWLFFLNQDLSSITPGGDNVMTILRLSYNHLSRHLKICFAYCSLFPKDFQISRVDLIGMWIAQGFIQSTNSSKDVEDVATSYFTDLLRRSFFQETEEDKSFPHFYKMHDLIHDLAKEVADREFLTITTTEDAEILPEHTLHASCLFQIDDSLEFPNPFCRKHKKLRTFIHLSYSFIDTISYSTLEGIISSFECLRVLDLHHLQIFFLPQSLGGLKHLRYLAISSEFIVTLPSSITELHNLQVLKLVNFNELKMLPRDIWRLVSLRRLECQGCFSLTHIPPGLWKLTSLMHLDFDEYSFPEDMPPGVGQLTSLRTLTCFIVGKESCTCGLASEKLNELKGLVDLRNRLTIKFMGRVHSAGEIKPTDILKGMKHLLELSVEFKYRRYGENEADFIMLEALQPHQNIQILKIKNYCASRFPDWLMVENLDLLLPKLVNLYIEDCHKCQKLPPIWKLPSLQSLVLHNPDSVKNIDGLEEGDDDNLIVPSATPYFPSLKRLALGIISEKLVKLILLPPHHSRPLSSLSELTLDSVEDLEIMSEDIFRNLTSLQFLYICECRNLIYLSTCITHLTSIELHNCPLLDLSNEETLAPTNLSTFRVSGLDKLMTLPVWLQHSCGSLELIEIGYCPNLTTIPEWIGNLSALNLLGIQFCPMLTSLPEGMRSLTALQILRIEECSSSLHQRCRKEGEDWPKIAHIPTVIILENSSHPSSTCSS